MKILTGIKPTGKLHLGHYFSCIKPALELQEEGHDVEVLIAQIHALNTLDVDTMTEYANAIEEYIKSIGLKCVHQSEETLACFALMLNKTTKGQLERCHAYKSLKNKDQANMGLLTYPVLMSTDIYLSKCDKVLVGNDQEQHIEIARDLIKKYDPEAKLPESLIYHTFHVVGFDGRKMSKSYNNTLTLDATNTEIKEFIMKIKTGSEGVEESKDVRGTPLVELHDLITGGRSMFAFKLSRGGFSYKEAKEELITKMIDFYNEEIR